MLVFDLTVQLTVGSVFALGSREELTRPEVRPLETPAFRTGVLYSGLFYIPSAVFFFYAWPGWNSMYLLDLEGQRLWGSWFIFLDMLALLGAYVGGFLVTGRLLVRGGGRCAPTLKLLGVTWAVVAAVLFVLLWGRSFTVTSYQAFTAGEWPRFSVRWGAPDSFFGHPLMWYLLFWAACDFGPLAYLYARARRRSRALP